MGDVEHDPPAPFAPDWTIELVDRPEQHAVIESLLCTSSAGFATRAASELAEGRPVDGVVRVSGIYRPDPVETMEAGPSWIPTLPAGVGQRWRLDLRKGVVEHEITLGARGRVRTIRFGSQQRPGVGVFWVVDGPDGLIDPDDDVEPMLLEGVDETAVVSLVDTTASGTYVRVAGVGRGSTKDEAGDAAASCADAARGVAPAELAQEQSAAWEHIWSCAEVAIEGNAADELAARFALFHLLSLGDGRDELAVGARGLTGPGYAGHVFWDSDVYVLPALAAIDPAAAQAMLRYRANRLGPARERASAEARPGARFPWESAATGTEVTPSTITAPDGTTLEVTTGDQEIHINSDIAWAVMHHARWTGDSTFLDGLGSTIVLETARYMASRIEVDAEGAGHIRGVMGPDEYHDAVDDSAFTNVMARWHLRTAAQLTVDPAEAGHMRQLAKGLVDGYAPQSGHHEEFAGYDALELALVSDIAEPPVAVDLLMGHERVAQTQIIKQADVVMLHHLVPGELPPGSRDADLDYYLPRTSHGSSLSPAIYASVLARAGRPDEALGLLRIALRLDLDDLTGTASGGVHIATIGGLWQALAFGFLGLAADGEQLTVDPVLPAEWDALRLRCRVLQRQIEVSAAHDEVTVEADGPLTLGWPGAPEQGPTDRLRLVGGAGSWRTDG